MKFRRAIKVACVFLIACYPCAGGDADLTIYNQNFAVVREMVPLDLKKGITEVRLTDMTGSLEPDSVMLRDPQGKHALRIVEQSYRADPVSQGLLLALNEGKTIDFLVQEQGRNEVVQGKIVRSGYTLAGSSFVQTQYGMQQVGNDQPDQPIIEIGGKLRFGLPGTPLFPPLLDETIVKPTLSWQIQSETAGRVNAELSYVTGGLNWDAAYNVVAPETGDLLDLTGWVTMRNQTGKTFENARIKLMAGNVNKVQMVRDVQQFAIAANLSSGGFGGQPPVTEKKFDEYHLYELHQPTTLHDKETKQVEFTSASGVQSNRYYVYDGFKIDSNRYQGWGVETIRQQSDYGTQSNPSVWVMREFANTTANHLGIPLPAGRIRFYRRDTDGHLEFTGENMIEHTAQDETLHIFTGTAFDIVGERKQTSYRINQNQNARAVDESFEIKLRNHTKEAVEIRVVEHLYRGYTWTIGEHSDPFQQTDSRTAEFRVKVEPGGEKTVTYAVHYTW
ncbi:MAG TPA: DUF4139 domain-containing protein [Candidatus Acidoferrales bacterium]|nr:DUF4139 domain-containing protein [Candidatus Acidoferrales bacterium]